MTPECRRWLAKEIERALVQWPRADTAYLLGWLLAASDLPIARQMPSSTRSTGAPTAAATIGA